MFIGLTDMLYTSSIFLYKSVMLICDVKIIVLVANFGPFPSGLSLASEQNLKLVTVESEETFGKISQISYVYPFVIWKQNHSVETLMRRKD